MLQVSVRFYYIKRHALVRDLQVNLYSCILFTHTMSRVRQSTHITDMNHVCSRVSASINFDTELISTKNIMLSQKYIIAK